jgi:hypothetical protein
MRIVIVVLALLMTTFQANGQILGKKKSKNVDPRDAQIDSLTTLTKTLSLSCGKKTECSRLPKTA